MLSKSPQATANKLLQKKERKSKAIDVVDQIGGEMLGKDTDKEHNDSFEKYYNKDLDLEEGKHLLS
jgi:hypothetical protein